MREGGKRIPPVLLNSIPGLSVINKPLRRRYPGMIGDLGDPENGREINFGDFAVYPIKDSTVKDSRRERIFV